MLVLQRRMDLAMDEIQELRTLVQLLQRELQARVIAPEDRTQPNQVDWAVNEDQISTPTAPTLTNPINWNESLDLAMHLQAFELEITPRHVDMRSMILPGFYVLLLILFWLLNTGTSEFAVNLLTVHVTWDSIMYIFERTAKELSQWQSRCIDYLGTDAQNQEHISPDLMS